MLPDRGTWYAEVTFRGALSEEQAESLFTHAGVKSSAEHDGFLVLRWREHAADMAAAFAKLRDYLAADPLAPLIRGGMLSDPIGFEVLDETLYARRTAKESGLPLDTPFEEQGRIMLERLAKAYPKDGDRALCATCGQGCRFQDCPTGGWRVHEQHPADGHDAELGQPTTKQPGCTCWSVNDKHSLNCRLAGQRIELGGVA